MQRIKKRPQRGREYGFCWVSRSLPGKYVCSKEGVISFRELFDLGKGCVAGKGRELGGGREHVGILNWRTLLRSTNLKKRSLFLRELGVRKLTYIL